MGYFKNLFNTISDRIKSKSYSGFFSGGLPTSSTVWGKNHYLNANEISLYTNRTIAKRAEKVGEIEFVLKNKNGDVIDGKNDIIDILNNPNKVFTGPQFWALNQKYYDLTGESYIWIEQGGEFGDSKKIKGLHILPSQLVTPIFNEETGELVRFDYRTTNATIPYPPEEIVYLRNPDPKSPMRGQSLLKAGVTQIQTEIQINTYHARILDNGGKVEGVFKFKTGPLTEQQLKDVKAQYQKEYGSAKKSGLPLFLGGDADYVKTGLTPDELSFLDAKKMTLDDICIMTGVPKAVLGTMDGIKFSNADASIKIFLRETIKPLLAYLTTALDHKLFPSDIKLDYVDPTPENVEEKLKETENGIKNYYMTINEARKKNGLDPIADGDDIMVPFNVTPLGDDVSGGNNEKKLKKTKQIHPNSDPDVREIYGKMQIKRMDNREKKFISVLNKYLKGQLERLVKELQPEQTRVFRKKNLLDDSLNLELEVKIGNELFVPVITELLKDAGIDAMEFAGSGFEFNMGADIKSWIEDRSNVFLTQINATTLETLQKQFAESLEAGESRDKLVKRIEDTYGNISKSRAQTIARTEVHNSTQFGTLEGYRQGGLNTKIWVAVLDLHTRDSHAMIDGEERPLDIPFSNGLMMPGDPNGSAAEVINCRCVI